MSVVSGMEEPSSRVKSDTYRGRQRLAVVAVVSNFFFSLSVRLISTSYSTATATALNCTHFLPLHRKIANYCSHLELLVCLMYMSLGFLEYQ